MTTVIMADSINDSPFVFIIGSPRSGTTILGEVLDKHNGISQWYEPYFVWDRYFRDRPHDERVAEDATAKVTQQISRAFLRYRSKMGDRIIVDKSPRNSLKIPFIRAIFPEAYFIHILRDGRDATLSIHREWIRRNKIVNASRDNKFNYRAAYSVIKEWLSRQPFLADKMRALWFETHGHFFNKSRHLNRLRWNGEVGWGPRFKGWEKAFARQSLLQFNAMQWLECIEGIRKNWLDIPAAKRIELRYEDFVSKGRETIEKILKFLNLEGYEEFWESMPGLKQNNTGKWRGTLTGRQREEIHPVLAPMLTDLGYEETRNWSSDKV